MFTLYLLTSFKNGLTVTFRLVPIHELVILLFMLVVIKYQTQIYSYHFIVYNSFVHKNYICLDIKNYITLKNIK